jgi:hypothetical protein
MTMTATILFPSPGADPGGAHALDPPLGLENMIFWHKIVIFHTKYPHFVFFISFYVPECTTK